MTPDRERDSRINDLVNGLNKVVDAISGLRNLGGDAHGLSTRRISVNDYHARLAVNAAITVADFVLSVQTAQLR